VHVCLIDGLTVGFGLLTVAAAEADDSATVPASTSMLVSYKIADFVSFVVQ
jgi:hypothetical protein